MALAVSKSKQAAPEYGRRMVFGGSVFENRYNGVHAVVGAKVATRCCYTTVENEVTIGVVEQCLPRCGGSESPHFPTISILDNMYTRNRSGVIPQITPCPTLTH
jgi:hypothetical protein